MTRERTKLAKPFRTAPERRSRSTRLDTTTRMDRPAADDDDKLHVQVLHGPNLNLLGTREPGVYGIKTLADVEALCRAEAAKYELEADCRQSNHEGTLIDWIHEAGSRQAAGDLIGAVFNPGAYTHTSLALHDAIKGAKLRLIECHISNVHTREEFRSHSFISPAAAGIVVGFGVDGYAVAIHGLHRITLAEASDQ